MFPKFAIFSYILQKCQLGKIIYEKIKNNFSQKIFVKKENQNMGCPMFAKLPTPLVLFCQILLDPPPTKNRTSLMDVP